MNPLDWITNIGQWLVRSVQDIASGIARFTTWIIGWVTNIVSWISGLYNEFLSWVNAAIQSLWRSIGGIWDWVNQIANAVIPNIVHWVSNGINTVTRWAENAYNSVVGWATDGFNRLWGWLTGLVDWINHSIVQPIWTRLTGLEQWVIHTVIGWVQGLVHALSNSINNVIGWAQREFGEVTAWVRNQFAPIWEIIDKVIGWLEWFARHPFSWFTDLLHHAADRAARDVLAAVMHAFSREGDAVETWFARWLGGSMTVTLAMVMTPWTIYRRFTRSRGRN